MTLMANRLPIGMQDFASLRRERYVYIDKTRHIADILWLAGGAADLR
jgi:hypothetical protein